MICSIWSGIEKILLNKFDLALNLSPEPKVKIQSINFTYIFSQIFLKIASGFFLSSMSGSWSSDKWNLTESSRFSSLNAWMLPVFLLYKDECEVADEHEDVKVQSNVDEFKMFELYDQIWIDLFCKPNSSRLLSGFHDKHVTLASSLIEPTWIHL